jgi:hypothetical protein
MAAGEVFMSCETGLDDPLLSEIYAYWRSKCATRRMPARRDIDPGEMPKLLPYLLLSEVAPGGRFRYRLSGTAVAHALRQDITGRCVEEVTSGAYCDHLNALQRTVCCEGTPLFAASLLPCGSRTKYRFSRRLLLPLSDDGATVNQILSLVVFQFGVGASALTRLDAATVG